MRCTFACHPNNCLHRDPHTLISHAVILTILRGRNLAMTAETMKPQYRTLFLYYRVLITPAGNDLQCMLHRPAEGLCAIVNLKSTRPSWQSTRAKHPRDVIVGEKIPNLRSRSGESTLVSLGCPPPAPPVQQFLDCSRWWQDEKAL
jgi:hypothetical protein